MRKHLKALYLKLDTSSSSLSNIALAQLILKVIYFYDKPVPVETITGEISSILEAKLSTEKVIEAIDLLLRDSKIKPNEKGFTISSTKRKKIDQAHEEYTLRMDRVYDKYFSSTDSEKTAITNWFENVTITFFTEFKSEWIAERVYNVRSENPYDGLKKIITRETQKDKDIDIKDRDYLISQYLNFFQSSDEDLNSIFWDFGTSAYSSSLIVSTNSANQITIDVIRNSTFIFDTNILMYISLESGKYFNAYSTLGKIFKALDITPAYFHITRAEYLRSMANKREQILKIISKYEPSIYNELNDDFINTAIARGCIELEDYERFFDTLLDMPTEFCEGIDLKLLDNPELNEIITKGSNDEDLIDQLNKIFINRHKYNGKSSFTTENKKNEKGKSRKPLEHDAGLIRGAEELRSQNNCFIITREISVKQYGILNPKRDEPFISIGLDTLIGLLSLDTGGVEIDPNNFKPLFAKMVKLALLPEKGTFVAADLSRMLDIEQHIADLSDDDIKSIAKEIHKYQLSDMSDEKITTEIVRKFQASKMKLKQDLTITNAELASERNQKNIYKRDSIALEDVKKENDNLKFENHWARKKRRYVYHLISFVLFILGLLWCFLNKDNVNLHPYVKRAILIVTFISTILFNLFFNNHGSFKDSWEIIIKKTREKLREEEKKKFLKD